MNAPELTVVVTTRNRAHLIDETLAALADQEWDGDWDLLLVDNGSTDSTLELAEAWQAKMPVPMRLITATERHNPSYSRNVAVALTDATSVAFVDDDDIVAPGWVAAIGVALRGYEFVGSRLAYDLLNPSSLAADAIYQSERHGRHFGVDVVASCGSGCRTSLWRELGGSDEAFRGIEDTEFSLRVTLRGDVTPEFVDDAIYQYRLRDSVVSSYRRGLGRGQGHVQLHRAHGAAFAVRADSPLRVAARWVRLLLQIPTLLSPRRRLHWAEDAGRRVGSLTENLSGRTWCS